MPSSRRSQLILLAILLAVLVVVLRWNSGATAGAPAAAKAGQRPARPARPAARAAAPVVVEALRLDALGRARAEPADPGRDLFQLGEVRAARLGAAGPVHPGPPVPMPSANLPPPAPNIALKFVGIVHPQHQAEIAVLSDGTNVFYGREGETIDGRYRIERIGVESIEMAFIDGHGRQVIRLSGS